MYSNGALGQEYLKQMEGVLLSSWQGHIYPLLKWSFLFIELKKRQFTFRKQNWLPRDAKEENCF